MFKYIFFTCDRLGYTEYCESTRNDKFTGPELSFSFYISLTILVYKLFYTSREHGTAVVFFN